MTTTRPPSPRRWFLLAALLSIAGSAPPCCAEAAAAAGERQALEHYAAGEQALASERFDEAKAEFRKAIAFDARLVPAHYGLGQAHMALEEYQEAVQAYLGCRKAFAEQDAGRLMGEAEWDRRLADQIQALEDAIIVMTSGSSSKGYSRGPIGSSVSDLQRQIGTLKTWRLRHDYASRSTPPWISLALGSAYFRSGAFADAEREYQAALRVDAKVGEAHNDLAVVYLVEGRVDEARHEVELAELCGFGVRDGLKKEIAQLGEPGGQLAEAARAPGSAARSYARIVESYASGARTAAIEEVGALPERALKGGVRSVREATLAEGRACPTCAPRASFRAALMLHTDRALADRAALRGSGGDGCGGDLQLWAAEQIAEAAGTLPAARGFVRRWSIAMAQQGRRGCLEDALRWARLGLKWFPRDARLLVIRGAIQETLAAIVQRPPQSSPPGLSDRQAREVRGALRESRGALTLARADFEKALSLDGDLLEARLRLGRVLSLLGEADRARAELAAVLERWPGSSMAYLAHLFLGQLEEAAGRVEAARAEYASALEIHERAQVAAVALSHALLMNGSPTDSRTVLKKTLGFARRRDSDPYWTYLLGGSDLADGLFAELRMESLP